MPDKVCQEPNPHQEERPSAVVDPFLLATVEERGVRLADILLAECLAPSSAVAALWTEGITSLEDLATHRGGFTRTSYFQRWPDALRELRAELDRFLISLLDSIGQDLRPVTSSNGLSARRRGEGSYNNNEVPHESIRVLRALAQMERSTHPDSTQTLWSRSLIPSAPDALSDTGDLRSPQDEPLSVEEGKRDSPSPMCQSDDVPLDVLDLSCRAYNCLRRAGLHTVAKVATLTDEQILSIRNLGVSTLNEIREKLASFGFEPPVAPVVSDSAPPLCAELVDDDTPIAALGLSTRSYNALVGASITTMGQLRAMSVQSIRNVRNIGVKALAEIQDRLADYAAHLPSSSSDTALTLLRQLSPRERLRMIAQALSEMERDLSVPRRPPKSLP